VRAIRNVVASSVPNLKPDKVTVTDQANRTLAAGSEETGFTSATADAAKASTEAQMQARIKDIVEGVVGAGAARVQVTADIDHSRSTTQEQKFDPDGQVVRSTSTNGSQSQDTTGQQEGATATAPPLTSRSPPQTFRSTARPGPTPASRRTRPNSRKAPPPPPTFPAARPRPPIPSARPAPRTPRRPTTRSPTPPRRR